MSWIYDSERLEREGHVADCVSREDFAALKVGEEEFSHSEWFSAVLNTPKLEFCRCPLHFHRHDDSEDENKTFLTLHCLTQRHNRSNLEVEESSSPECCRLPPSKL